MCDEYPPRYLRGQLIDQHPQQLQRNSVNDPYYQRYQLISSLYRLCAFLGWLELYRQDVDLTLLDPKRQRLSGILNAKGLDPLISNLADGHLNTAPSVDQWEDRLIFREELRAIGEGMITDSTNPRVVIGYADFVGLFDQASSEEHLWWLRVARNFLLDMKKTYDFRRERLNGIRVALGRTIELLEAN